MWGLSCSRKLLRDQIRLVQDGSDPIGVNLDPEKDEMIRLIPEGYTAYTHALEEERLERRDSIVRAIDTVKPRRAQKCVGKKAGVRVKKTEGQGRDRVRPCPSCNGSSLL